MLVLREQQLQNAVFYKESFVFACLTYRMSCKVRASSLEYTDVEKINNLREQNSKGQAYTKPDEVTSVVKM